VLKRESVRIWVHRFSSLFRPSRRVRRLVAVDETVLKVKGQICYLWAAIDVDTNEILAVYASKGRGIPSAIKFLRKVLDSCEGKPLIVVDRVPGYRLALERLEKEFSTASMTCITARILKGLSKTCQY
jgi:transposase-like protein